MKNKTSVSKKLLSRYDGKAMSLETIISMIDRENGYNNLSSNILNVLHYLIQKQVGKEIKARPITDPFKLASLFMGKKDVRYYLNYVYSDGIFLTASNGHIAAKIKHQCDPGYYDGAGNLQADVDAKYPDFTKVISCETKQEVIISEAVEDIISGYHVMTIGGIHYQKIYVDKLKKVGCTSWRILQNHALIGELNNHIFMVMNIKV